MTTRTTSRRHIAEVTTDHLAAELNTTPDRIRADDVLKELPGADSMKLLRVVSKLEREWDVEFDDQDIFAAQTVDDLVTLVQKHLDGEQAA